MEEKKLAFVLIHDWFLNPKVSYVSSGLIFKIFNQLFHCENRENLRLLEPELSVSPPGRRTQLKPTGGVSWCIRAAGALPGRYVTFRLSGVRGPSDVYRNVSTAASPSCQKHSASFAVWSHLHTTAAFLSSSARPLGGTLRNKPGDRF